MHDKYGHVTLADELYFNGNHLVKTRCKNINKKKIQVT